MIPSYMKESYSGAFSAIQYAQKGDIVYIIDRSHDGITLVTNQNGLKFYIHETKLSNTPVERDAISIPTKPSKRKVR